MDIKVGKISFDDLFDEYLEEIKVVIKKKEGTIDVRQIWGFMGLGVSECVCVYVCIEVYMYFFKFIQ